MVHWWFRTIYFFNLYLCILKEIDEILKIGNKLSSILFAILFRKYWIQRVKSLNFIGFNFYINNRNMID